MLRENIEKLNQEELPVLEENHSFINEDSKSKSPLMSKTSTQMSNVFGSVSQNLTPTQSKKIFQKKKDPLKDSTANCRTSRQTNPLEESHVNKSQIIQKGIKQQTNVIVSKNQFLNEKIKEKREI